MFNELRSLNLNNSVTKIVGGIAFFGLIWLIIILFGILLKKGELNPILQLILLITMLAYFIIFNIKYWVSLLLIPILSVLKAVGLILLSSFSLGIFGAFAG